MKIAVIGGGPGGLYFAILTKKAMPSWQIDVYERNKPDDSFGFGVVFSDETLGEFLLRDLQSYELIRSRFAYWDDIVVARDGMEVSISGNGFCGCSRKTLLQLLHRRCREEGVGLHFEAEVSELSRFADADILVACDGIGSQIRSAFEKEFGTSVVLNRNRFVWCGSTKPLDAFTYFFRSTPHGLMVAHSYQYEEGMSTWIFECTDETWRKSGFEVANEADTLARLEKLFAAELGGHTLIGNKSHWRQFPRVHNRKWWHNNIVLLGDAKATAHFSIGSGTKLAMECAIALSDALIAHPDSHILAFEQYEKARRSRVESIQKAATVSLSWFENMNRYRDFDFMQFAFGCMTRSRKVTWENLRLRDQSFTEKVLDEFVSRNEEKNESGPARSAAFTPFHLRGLKMENRIAMNPMGLEKAENGLINEWHFQHYASRALGGLGLILTETVAVSEDGRSGPGTPGIYSSNQAEAWKRLVDFVHGNSSSVLGIELGHCGFHRDLSQAEKDSVRAQFASAAEKVLYAGFDWIQFHTLNIFNPGEREKELSDRCEFALELFRILRRIFPQDKPVSVHLPPFHPGQNFLSEDDFLFLAGAFSQAGADILFIPGEGGAESGPVSSISVADAIRNKLRIPVMAGGNIQDIDQINTLIMNGNADLIAAGNVLLADPFFAWHARAYEGLGAGNLPLPYAHSYPAFSQHIQRKRKQTEAMKKALKPKSNKL